MNEEADPLEALYDARIVFWACSAPAKEKHRVHWDRVDGDKLKPHCLDCGEVGPPR